MLRKVDKAYLKVPAHIDYLGELRDFVTQIGKKHKFSNRVINAFKLGVDEASTNIIRHAYRDSEGHITIRAIIKKDSMTLSIIDQGMFFDPQRVKDPDLNRYVDIGKKGGLGIFIMRKLMDEIDYRRTEEGNELRITKYRDTSQKKDKASNKTGPATPSSIKSKFFFRTIAFITLLGGAGYGYFYIQAEDVVVRKFISSAQISNTQIVNRLSAAVAENEYIDDEIGERIYEDHINRVYRLAVEDGRGDVEYTSNPNNEDILFKPFARPEASKLLIPGVYRYALEDGEIVYEFERDIQVKGTARKYGKAHIFISASNTEAEIAANRMRNLKLALTAWGTALVFVALLIYLLMSPLQKLSDWIKDLGHGEIGDEIDIDASSEIGEIAMAFSDITHKFRESQRHRADQERLQKEMEVAQEIQRTLLPMEFPDLDGYEISSYYEAAMEVGGDYYDFVEVDKDTLGIVVADVSGKGVPGSLVMTMIRTALRTEARGLKDAGEVLARVNEFVSNDIKKGMFVTIFYLIIDSKKRRINYASAGHNPMILYRGSTEKTYYLNPKGFPIGIQLPQKDLFRRSIHSETIQLAKDDILLVYTDGITEAMNPNRQLYGEERLLETIRDYGHLEVHDFVEKLKNGIYSFTEGNQQYDDISLVAIKEKSTVEEDELRRAKEAHRLISTGMSIREAFNSVNLTTYAYYNKYKKIFEQGGLDSIEVDEDVSVEAKHLSIEEKTKILDIIANHPEFGPGRISEELNTEKYSFTEISENKIYDELVRSRLNTRQLREAYINKSKRSNRPPKTPGTPLMTLDGRIIVDREQPRDFTVEKKPEREAAGEEQKVHTTIENDKPAEGPAEAQFDNGEQRSGEVETERPSALNEADVKTETGKDEGVEADALINISIDEVLSRDTGEEQPEDMSTLDDQLPANDEDHLDPAATIRVEADLSFEELISEPSLSDEIGEENGKESLNSDHSGLDTSFLEDISLEQFFDDTTNLFEESFDDEEYELSNSENGPVGQPDSQGQEDSSLTIGDDSKEVPEVSSKEEAESIEAAPQENGKSKVFTPEATSKVTYPKKSSKALKEDVSFADLLNALDEEIVYVKDRPGKKSSKVSGKNSSRKKVKHEETPKWTERETILVKGIKYYKNKDYNNAIEEFDKVIKAYPDYKEAHSILGNAYFRNDMYEEAAKAYAAVKKIDAEDVSAYENMGVIYANRGEMKQAVGEWKRVLELNPDREDIANKIKKALKMT